MDFPVSRLEAGVEIRQLVVERGINNLTSRIIRAHLESKFGLSFEDHKAEVDKITAEQIHEVQSDKKPIKNETSDDKEIDAGAQIKTENAEIKIEYAPVESEGEGDSIPTKNASDESSDESSNSSECSPAESSSNHALRATVKLEVSNTDNRKRPSTATVNLQFEDMASGIKRRRSTQLRPRREVSKKEPRKKNQNSGDPKTKRQTAFSRICVLSNELHDLTGKRYMRRSDVVKWMWNYFNTNNLKDPKNKQMILLDDRLKTDTEFLDDATRQMVEAELADELNNDADDSKPDLDTLKVSDVKNELSVQENDVGSSNGKGEDEEQSSSRSEQSEPTGGDPNCSPKNYDQYGKNFENEDAMSDDDESADD